MRQFILGITRIRAHENPAETYDALDQNRIVYLLCTSACISPPKVERTYTIERMNTNDIALPQAGSAETSDEFADESVGLRRGDGVGWVGAVDVDLHHVSTIDLVLI